MSQKGFFSKLPTIKYPYKGKIVKGEDNQYVEYMETVDITTRFKPTDTLLTGDLSYQTYVWQDEDRPDTVAYFYYGDPKYHWVVMFSSQIFDWAHDLPMTATKLLEYSLTKWAGKTINGVTISDNPTESELDAIHHYEVDGYIVDLATYNASAQNKSAVSIIDYERNENEERRIIRLLDNNYLTFLVKEYEDYTKQLKISRKKNKVETSL